MAHGRASRTRDARIRVVVEQPAPPRRARHAHPRRGRSRLLRWPRHTLGNTSLPSRPIGTKLRANHLRALWPTGTPVGFVRHRHPCWARPTCSAARGDRLVRTGRAHSLGPWPQIPTYFPCRLQASMARVRSFSTAGSRSSNAPATRPLSRSSPSVSCVMSFPSRPRPVARRPGHRLRLAQPRHRGRHLAKSRRRTVRTGADRGLVQYPHMRRPVGAQGARLLQTIPRRDPSR